MTALGPKCRDLESMKNRIAQLMTVETSNHSSMGCVPCVFDFNLSLLSGARVCKPPATGPEKGPHSFGGTASPKVRGFDLWGPSFGDHSKLKFDLFAVA